MGTTPTWEDLYGPEAEAKRLSVSTSPADAPTAPELEKLDGMTREELLALCGRFAAVCGLSITLTKEETAQAMLDSLAEIALKPIVSGTNLRADINARMNAIDKWLDRVDGKPTQRIEQKVEHSNKDRVGEMTNEQLFALISQASVMGLLPGGVRLDDGKVVVDAEYVSVTG